MSDSEFIHLDRDVVYDTAGTRVTEGYVAEAVAELENDDVEVIDVSYPREDRTRDSEQ